MLPEAAQAGRSGWQRPWLPGAALALLFFALGLACLDDYGATWDEHETYLTSLQAAGGGPSGEPSTQAGGWHMLPGYYFVFDLARGLFSRLLVERAQLLDWIECQHLVHLVLASLSVFLLYQTALLLSGRVRTSLWIALALACFPKFVGHSQSNPKDLPALFAFVLVAYAMARLHVRKSWGNALLSGAALGFCFSVRELSVALPAVFGIWFFWEEGRRVLAEWRKGLAVALATVFVFLLCWPWLWPNPIARLFSVLRHLETVLDRKILYLGEIHRTVALPWHYTLVSLLIATPTVFLVAASFSATTLDPEQRPAFQRIRRLAWLWIVALFLLDAAGKTHYDGFRHLLVVLPGVCMLIGLGLENLAHLTARWLRSARAGILAPSAAVALAALSCWRMHPYQDAYLNEIVNLFVAGRAEEVFEVEYWGGPYKEGAAWLNAHAEANAEIYLPEMSQANFYLERQGKPLDDVEQFADLAVPRYFMTITRRGFYRPPVTSVVRTYEPVFEIRRQEAALLRIYKNDRKRSPRAPRRPRAHVRAPVMSRRGPAPSNPRT